VERFDLPQILRHNARFDMAKLQWLNGEYVRELPPERFHTAAVHALNRAGIKTDAWPVDYVTAALNTCLGKIKVFSELPAYAGFYFTEQINLAPEALAKDFTDANRLKIEALRIAFASLAPFDAASLEKALKAVAAENGVKAGVLVHPTRLACTGNTAGPSLYHLLEILGKDRVLARLDRALAATK
jgi:glutamyl-tRNA synthetase